MSDLLPPGAVLETLHTGMIWAEGPVWLPLENAVRWSDIPNDRILQYDLSTGRARIHRDGVEYTNGRALDLVGAVVQCSHGLRRVEREVDGVATSIIDSYGARRFNSPNDIVVASDASIWFTDPPYGILSDDEGHRAEQEYGGCFVFRYDEPTGALHAAITDMHHPNGLAFSPDESVLYVSDTAGGETPRAIRAYDVVDGACVGGRTLALIENGVSDGIRVDEEGRIWSSSADGVVVFKPDGTPVGRIAVPETVSNLCFGGEDGDELYITATTSLYRIRVNARQAARPSRR